MMDSLGSRERVFAEETPVGVVPRCVPELDGGTRKRDVVEGGSDGGGGLGASVGIHVRVDERDMGHVGVVLAVVVAVGDGKGGFGSSPSGNHVVCGVDAEKDTPVDRVGKRVDVRGGSRVGGEGSSEGGGGSLQLFLVHGGRSKASQESHVGRKGRRVGELGGG